MRKHFSTLVYIAPRRAQSGSSGKALQRTEAFSLSAVHASVLVCIEGLTDSSGHGLSPPHLLLLHHHLLLGHLCLPPCGLGLSHRLLCCHSGRICLSSRSLSLRTNTAHLGRRITGSPPQSTRGTPIQVEHALEVSRLCLNTGDRDPGLHPLWVQPRNGGKALLRHEGPSCHKSECSAVQHSTVQYTTV